MGLALLTCRVISPRLRPDGGAQQRHIGVAAMDQAQRPHGTRLRLQRHHLRAEPAKARDPVAHMGTDIEDEVA